MHIREVCHHIYVLPHSGGDIFFICLIKTRKPLRYFHETWYKCKAQSEDVQIENKYRNFFTYILKKLCLFRNFRKQIMSALTLNPIENFS